MTDLTDVVLETAMNYRVMMAAAVSTLLLLDCRRSAPQKATIDTPAPPDQSAASPAAMGAEEIGYYAENLYDWGRQQDWTKAAADLTALQDAVTKLKGAQPGTDLREADERLGTIEKAVQGRQPRALVHAANEMTRVAAEISRDFNPQVPAEVSLLDYYGRELELWSEEGNPAKLDETRTGLKKTWDALRSDVLSKGGTTEARRFDALVEQVMKAKTSTDFAAAATPILDTVDALEGVYQRAPAAKPASPAS